MGALLAFLASLLSGLAKAWVGEHEAASAEQKVGALQAEKNADDIAVKAVEARADTKPLTSDQLQEHHGNVPASDAKYDPDFRD